MDLLPQPLSWILPFVVVLGVLIFIHELGHYAAARWRGVHVERFAVGFGRAIASWTDRRGTEWRVGWIPLGGYVKLHGQERPEEASPEERARWRAGETFHEKPVRDRAIVVAAGPVANFALAALLFAAVFMAVGRQVPDPEAIATRISVVTPGSPAERAGLLAEDIVLEIDGAAVSTFEEIRAHVQAAGARPIALRIFREGRERVVTATPEALPNGGARLGIQAQAATRLERLDPVSAVWGGVVHTADVSWQTLAAVGQMITGQRGTEDVGGPLRIAQLSGQVAQLGLASLVTFMAVLSVNLALINLFPIPILDGGHLLFYAAEALRGRPLSPRAQEIGFRAGAALLLGLFVFATWNDLASLGVVRWVAGLLG